MIQRTRVGTLLLVAVGTAAVGWAIVRLLETHGVHLPRVSWLVDAAIVILAVVVLWSGLAVRAYQRGKRPTLDGIRAARTLVLAKAASLTGALLTGWYIAQVLVVLGDLNIEARRNDGIAAGIAAVLAVALIVVGLVAERWCQIPPRDSGEHPGEDTVGTPDAGSPA